MTTMFAPPAPPTEAQRRRLFHLNSPRPSGYGVPFSPWGEESEKKRGVFKPVANINSLRSRTIEKDIDIQEMPEQVTVSMEPVNNGDEDGVWGDLGFLPLSPLPVPAANAAKRSEASEASASPKKKPPALKRVKSVPRIQLNFNIDEMNSSIDDAIGSAHNMPFFQKPKVLPEPHETNADVIRSRPKVLDEPKTTLAGNKRLRPESFDAPQKESKAFACDGCRISKTKCQGGFPCTRCDRLGKECTRSPRAKKNAEVQKQDHFFGSVEDGEPEGSKQADQKPCYRNSWCIRPYRHPGHCRHIKMKSRARSKKQRL